MWPDIGIKSSPKLSKFCQKIFGFTGQSKFFKVAEKATKNWATFLFPRTFTNHPIWSHWTANIEPKKGLQYRSQGVHSEGDDDDFDDDMSSAVHMTAEPRSDSLHHIQRPLLSPVPSELVSTMFDVFVKYFCYLHQQEIMHKLILDIKEILTNEFN